MFAQFNIRECAKRIRGAFEDCVLEYVTGFFFLSVPSFQPQVFRSIFFPMEAGSEKANKK